MFVTYVVERRKRDAALNLLRPYGDLTYIGQVRIEWGVFWEIFELEFDTCPNGLANTLRVATESWDRASHRIDEVIETDCPEVKKALEPDPSHPSLSWCVRIFKERYAHWDTYWKAMGSCGVATNLFLRFCRHKGLISPQESLHGDRTEYFGDPSWETPESPRECHTVAVVRGFVIDWTARQFNSDAPYPRIWKDNGKVFRAKPAPASAGVPFFLWISLIQDTREAS
jgi:hypothetical protein